MSGLCESKILEFIVEQKGYGNNRFDSIVLSVRENIIPLIDDFSIQGDSFVLLLTGSDGRKENRPDASRVEMIAYANVKLSKDIILDIAGKIGELFMGYNSSSITHKVYGTNRVVVEPKYFDRISDFEDPYTDYNVFFPSRFMDGGLLFGSKETYNELFLLFQKNIIQAKYDDMKTFKKRIKCAEDITLKGNGKFKGNNITHFDFDKGEIYYEKTPQLEIGVKIGPLRYVQYKLCFLITQLIRTKKVKYDDFIGFESFTANKIEFLRNYIKGGLNESEIYNLQIIYYTFLKIHHQCQSQYKESINGITYKLTSDDSKLLQDMLKELHALVSILKVL